MNRGRKNHLGIRGTPTEGALSLSSTGGIVSRPEAIARKKLCAA